MNGVKLASKFSLEARTFIQGISMHVVAVVEYVLQCAHAAVEEDASKYEVRRNLFSLPQGVKIADQPEILHKAAPKALRTNLDNPTGEPGLEVYKFMEAALKIAEEAMSASGRTIVSKWRTVVRNEEVRGRSRNAPVQPSFVKRFPESVFTELCRALFPEIARRIKNDPG